MDSIVKRIKKLIRNREISCREFCNQTGIQVPTLDKQLKGMRALSLDTVCKLLEKFNEVSAEWLMRGKGDMYLPLNTGIAPFETEYMATITTMKELLDSKNKVIASMAQENAELKEQIEQLRKKRK